MIISQLLRDTAERFNHASDLVCREWTLAVKSQGICCPCNSHDFDRLVKVKIQELIQSQKLHRITEGDREYQKVSA